MNGNLNRTEENFINLTTSQATHRRGKRMKKYIINISNGNILWVLIRSILARAFLMISYMFSWRNKKNIDTFWLKTMPYLEMNIGLSGSSCSKLTMSLL